MTKESIPFVACGCGWLRPLIAVTLTDGSRPTESYSVTYACPQCGRAHLAGELPEETALGSTRAGALAAASLTEALRADEEMLRAVAELATGVDNALALLEHAALGFDVEISRGIARLRGTVNHRARSVFGIKTEEEVPPTLDNTMPATVRPRFAVGDSVRKNRRGGVGRIVQLSARVVWPGKQYSWERSSWEEAATLLRDADEGAT